MTTPSERATTVDLVLPERVDVTTVTDLRYALQVAVDAGVGDLVVDAAAVDVIDAAGLGMLLSTHRRCLRVGRRLVLHAPPPRLTRLLAVTRLHRVLVLDRPAAVTQAG